MDDINVADLGIMIAVILLIAVCIRTLMDTLRTQTSGITSFDDYCNWDTAEFSKERALNGITEFKAPSGENHLSEEETNQLRKNIEDNILSAARQYPDTVFYCYIPPYSIASWGEWRGENNLNKRFEAEEILISMLIKQENIKFLKRHNGGGGKKKTLPYF